MHRSPYLWFTICCCTFCFPSVAFWEPSAFRLCVPRTWRLWNFPEAPAKLPTPGHLRSTSASTSEFQRLLRPKLIYLLTTNTDRPTRPIKQHSVCFNQPGRSRSHFRWVLMPFLQNSVEPWWGTTDEAQGAAFQIIMHYKASWDSTSCPI